MDQKDFEKHLETEFFDYLNFFRGNFCFGVMAKSKSSEEFPHMDRNGFQDLFRKRN